MMRFKWHQDERGVYVCELPGCKLLVQPNENRWQILVETTLLDVPLYAMAETKEEAMKLGASWYHLYRALKEWPYDPR